jgi:exopolysaccharide biosynthesis polyprenyl glycosylphosphotransferase
MRDRIAMIARWRGWRADTRLLIVGDSALAGKIVEEIRRRPGCGYQVVGHVNDAPAGEGLGVPRLGALDEVDRVIATARPTGVLVARSERSDRVPWRALLAAQVGGIRVEDAVHVYEGLTGKIAIESLMPDALLLSPELRKSPLDLLGGRLISLVVAFVGLIVLLPVLALIALAVVLDSPGPVFFVQERVGWRGRPFRLLKFRTMHATAAPTSEWARDNEGRITRVGRWLRLWRLDELPQFINILRGDMNLVGPRPHPVTNLALFSARIPYYAARSLVRPGLTGWAQVRYGYANDLDEEIEKMRYDLYYIKRMSLRVDLRILLDSVKTVLSARSPHAAALASPPAGRRSPGPRPGRRADDDGAYPAVPRPTEMPGARAGVADAPPGARPAHGTPGLAGRRVSARDDERVEDGRFGVAP